MVVVDSDDILPEQRAVERVLAGGIRKKIQGKLDFFFRKMGEPRFWRDFEEKAQGRTIAGSQEITINTI